MQLLSPEMKAFLTVGAREEAIWEPRYHILAYAAAGFTSQSYFGETVGSATGGLRVTNMDKANAIGNPKRFSVEAFTATFIPGSFPSTTDATAATTLHAHINDAWEVLSQGHFQFRTIDKIYMNIAPLWDLPSGAGFVGGGAAVAGFQATAANATTQIATFTNGTAHPGAVKWLKAPIPLQSETPFFGDITYTSVVAITNAGNLRLALEGLLIRPLQ